MLLLLAKQPVPLGAQDTLGTSDAATLAPASRVRSTSDQLLSSSSRLRRDDANTDGRGAYVVGGTLDWTGTTYAAGGSAGRATAIATGWGAQSDTAKLKARGRITGGASGDTWGLGFTSDSSLTHYFSIYVSSGTSSGIIQALWDDNGRTIATFTGGQDVWFVLEVIRQGNNLNIILWDDGETTQLVNTTIAIGESPSFPEQANLGAGKALYPYFNAYKNALGPAHGEVDWWELYAAGADVASVQVTRARGTADTLGTAEQVTYTNLVRNPSFENNITDGGWTSQVPVGLSASSFTRDTGWSKYGTASLRITATQGVTGTSRAANYRTPIGTSGVPVVPGDVFYVAVDVNVLDAIPVGFVGLRVQWYDATGVLLSSSNSPRTQSAGVQRVEMTVTAPASAAFASVVCALFFDTTAATGETADAYFDGVMFVKTSAPTIPYFDGNNNGGVWTGTPNASASTLALASATTGTFVRGAADTLGTNDSVSRVPGTRVRGTADHLGLAYEKEVPSGNVGMWTLSDTDGTFRDSSASGNNGTVASGTVQTGQSPLAPEGQAKSAAVAVGAAATSRISVGGGSAYTFAGQAPFTVEAWIRDDAASGTRYIAGNHVAGGEVNGWGLRRSGTGGILILRNDGTTNSFVTDNGGPFTTPTHIVATYDGTSLRIYRNGSLTAGPGGANVTIPTGGTDLSIFNASTGDANAWNGALQYVAVYNRALTAQEALDRYNAGLLAGLSESATRGGGQFVRSAADTLGTSDSASRGTLRPSRATADTLGTSDAAVVAFTPGTTLYVRAAADTLGTSDSASRTANLSRSVSDTLGTSDSASRSAYVRARSTTDTLGTADSASRSAQSFTRATADTLGTSDSASRGAQSFTRAAVDTLGTSDSASRSSYVRSRATTDTLGTSDSASRGAQSFSRSTSDTLGTSDSASRSAYVRLRSTADTLGTSDSASRSAQSFTRATADTLGTSDAATLVRVFVRSASDTLGTFDSASRGAQSFSRSTADTLGTTDSASRGAQSFTRTSTDTLGTSDSATLVRAFVRSTNDTLGTSDSASRSSYSRSRSTTDTLGTSDSASRGPQTFSRSTADTLGTSDSASRGLQTFSRSTADTLGTSDSASRTAYVRLRATADALGTSDSASRGAQSYTRSASDTLGTSDAASRGVQAFTRTTVDTLGTNDSASRTSQTFTRTTADTLGTSDSATPVRALVRTAFDTLGTSDVATRGVQSFTRSAADTLGTSDVATRGAQTVFRGTADTLGTHDSALRATQSFARTATDTLGTTDSALIGAGPQVRTTADSLGTHDSATLRIAAVRSAADTLGTSDSASVRVVLHLAGADTLGTHDAASVRVVLHLASADTLGTSDVATLRVASLRSAADTLGTHDAASVRVVLHVVAADTLGTSDVAIAVRRLTVVAADTLGTTDVATRASYTRTRSTADTLGTHDAATNRLSTARVTFDTLGTSDSAVASQRLGVTASDTLGTHDVAVRVTTRQKTTTDSLTFTDVATVTTTLIAATVTLTSGPAPTKISKVTGYDLTTITWGTDLPFDEYAVAVVPTEVSPYTSATPIPALHDSANVHGAAGPYSEASDIETVIDGADLELASAGDGDKIVRVFVRRGSTWSGS